MQKFYSISAIGVLALLFSFGLNYSQRGEINAMRLEQKLYQSENRLLKDQIQEYAYKATTTRTYEEGLTDGLMRARNIGYTDGYHAAIAQNEETKEYFAELEKTRKEEQERIAAEEKQKTDSASKVSLPATTSDNK